ncbi:apolipoprotein N-acyltransferase [Aciditerrimonas ferrireducens]|uniref:apolipoprotein N-acyltransferase n=1 Tax=Aciditerrimonas ferrireducens TaxID=667306 RepID=UPI0020069137|nr:apolipoprotein N-acyltransferase [Aciditerrimonas ferrireducens]MCK4176909.1 apolipoprotein N-acyltransferase [Aciditerrimonas ferrireducens]
MSRQARARGPSRTRRVLRVGGPALVGGVLGALSVPPFGFWPLAAPGIALLAWSVRGRAWRGRLLAGWAFGLGLYVIGLWWALSFNVYGGVVLMLVEALAPGIAALLAPRRAGQALALPGGLVLAEALRTHWPFGGLPLGSMALGQAKGPLLPADRLGGPLLLVGLAAVAGVGLLFLVEALLGRWPALASRLRLGPEGGRRPPRPSRALAAGLTAVAAAAAVTLAGALAPSGGPSTARVTVASVQGGGRRGTSALQVPPATVFAAQVAATRLLPAAARHRHLTLVLWPEDVVALGDEHLRGSPQEAVIAHFARQLHASMVVGVTEDVGSTRFRNFAAAFSPTGRLLEEYEKVHRVPFGEYVPYRSFFAHFANLSEVPRNAIPGHGTGVLRIPGAVLGTTISFEVFFPARARDPVRHGADLLIVPTNTSSYRTSQVPTQEVAADQLQAVSEGRWLVQAAPTGYSDVVTPTGRVVAKSVLGRRAVLVATVGLRHGLTVFARFGELPVLLVAGLAVLAGWARALGLRRRSRPVQS